MNTPTNAAPAPFGLTVGPVPYYWTRATLQAFYAGLADSAADTIVLGETTCARRHEMKPADWIALGTELRASGKDVWFATQTLIESDADLRVVQRFVDETGFGLEAGDASALQLCLQAGRPFALGPHVNVYSRAALDEYRRLGALRWIAPVELPLESVARIADPALPTEVFAFGRLPLAFSARCFTARHHRLAKDRCEFRCADDGDGLLLATTEGEPFLVLNGTQVQSAGQHCLIGHRVALHAAGVTRLRLSPVSARFAEVVDHFDAVMNRGASADAARIALDAMSLPGGLVDGYAYGRAGLDWIPA